MRDKEQAVHHRAFRLETLLTITTGTMLGKIDDVYDILNYMTGDNLFTHQLPLAAGICKHALWAQYPLLKYARTESVDGTNWLWHIHDKRQKFGNYFRVIPLEHWVQRDPIADMERMVDPEKIIVVQM